MQPCFTHNKSVDLLTFKNASLFSWPVAIILMMRNKEWLVSRLTGWLFLTIKSWLETPANRISSPVTKTLLSPRKFRSNSFNIVMWNYGLLIRIINVWHRSDLLFFCTVTTKWQIRKLKGTTNYTFLDDEYLKYKGAWRFQRNQKILLPVFILYLKRIYFLKGTFFGVKLNWVRNDLKKKIWF